MERYDDALDVVGVHMVGSVIGVVLTGAFASLVVNAAGVSGGWSQLGRQSVLAIVGLAYPFLMTWIILWATDKTVGLRVSPNEEAVGLDLGEHTESGYEWPGTTIQLAGATAESGHANTLTPNSGGDGVGDPSAVL